MRHLKIKNREQLKEVIKEYFKENEPATLLEIREYIYSKEMTSKNYSPSSMEIVHILKNLGGQNR